MMKNTLVKSIIAGSMVLGVSVMASQPVQISITPEIALHRKTERIKGLSLSIWGENPQTALALGIVNWKF